MRKPPPCHITLEIEIYSVASCPLQSGGSQLPTIQYMAELCYRGNFN